MTDLDLDELRRLTREATAGAWWVQDGDVMSHVEGAPGLTAHLFAADEATDTDADLIVAVRNTLPELLDRIERLEAALHQQQEIVIFDEDGWAIEHLVSCRKSGMTNCVLHRVVAENADDLVAEHGTGRFEVSGWKNGRPVLVAEHDDE